MRIVNPTFGLSSTEAQAATATAAINWDKDPIVIFGNNKPNAKELLDGLRAKLLQKRSENGIDYLFKNSASNGAPAGMIEEISQKYKVALLALAD